MDRVMKSRISRWRSVRASRSSSSLTRVRPMGVSFVITEQTYGTEQMSRVKLSGPLPEWQEAGHGGVAGVTMTIVRSALLFRHAARRSDSSHLAGRVPL